MANPSKQGIRLGEMPLTLFLLVAAAVLYIHFAPKTLAKVTATFQKEDAAGNPVGPKIPVGNGPVQVVPQQGGLPVLPPPPWKVIVPAPGQAR